MDSTKFYIGQKVKLKDIALISVSPLSVSPHKNDFLNNIFTINYLDIQSRACSLTCDKQVAHFAPGREMYFLFDYLLPIKPRKMLELF